MARIDLENPDMYTDEEKQMIKDHVCPECKGNLRKHGNKLDCEDWENCGFFCSIKETK